MTDPETLARERWKEAARALDARDRVARLLDEASGRAAQLRERLPAAAHEARLTQAHAIVAGKPLPANDEPDRLQAELASLEDRLPVLELALDIIARACTTSGDVSRTNGIKSRPVRSRKPSESCTRRAAAKTGKPWPRSRLCSPGSTSSNLTRMSAWRRPTSWPRLPSSAAPCNPCGPSPFPPRVLPDAFASTS